MYADFHLKKEHYKHLAEVFLILSKLFGRLRKGKALKTKLSKLWPKDKVLKEGLQMAVSGFDLFVWSRYRKTEAGESPLDQYTRLSKSWKALSKKSREAYELKAQEYTEIVHKWVGGEKK